MNPRRQTIGARKHKAYRKPKSNPMENRPTFDRFPEELLFPMNLYRMK